MFNAPLKWKLQVDTGLTNGTILRNQEQLFDDRDIVPIVRLHGYGYTYIHSCTLIILKQERAHPTCQNACIDLVSELI